MSADNVFLALAFAGSAVGVVMFAVGSLSLIDGEIRDGIGAVVIGLALFVVGAFLASR
jgi:hypothetical protein